jgi:hypothetical protein
MNAGWPGMDSRWLLGVLLLATAAVVAYLPGLHGGFVFDDFPNILQNSAFKHLDDWSDWVAAAMSSPARDLPRPLAMLSFALNIKLGGLDVVPFKAVNIAIHATNAILASFLALRLFASAPAPARAPRACALLTASLWALHPVNATAVLLVVQRMEILSHVFVFAGLLAYSRIRLVQAEKAGGWLPLYVVTLACTAVGILAKESAALLPLYALWLDACVFGFRTQGEGRKLLVFYTLCLVLPAVLGLSWLLPKALSPGAFSSREFNLSERLLTEPRVLLEYVRWFFLPDVRHLSFYHDDFPISHGLLNPASTLAAITSLVAIAIGAWLGRRRFPLVALGLLWFLSAHALTATFVPLELVFEHRNYFATFGLSLAVVAAVAHACRALGPRAARRALALGLAAVVMLGFLTNLRARDWRNPLVFAITEAAKQPNSPRATYYKGWLLSNYTEFHADSPGIDTAIATLEHARSLKDSGILADHALLILASRTGRPLRTDWWRHMQSQLRINPIGPHETGALASLVNCQIARLCHFPQDEMMATITAALSHGPHAIILGIYANYALNELDDDELALRLWRDAHALEPAEREHQIAIVKVLIRDERFDEAAREIDVLRGMGRLGQHRRAADELQVRLAQARRAAAGSAAPRQGR